MTLGLCRSITLLVSVLFVSACGMRYEPDETITGDSEREPMDSLVSAEWLASNIDDTDLVVLDATVLTIQDENGELLSVSGRDEFMKGHVPGAAFADLMGALSNTDSPYRFAVPEAEQFAAAMEALGVGDGRRVVLYDSQGSMWAARVWWMLRWIGFDEAAILNGGLDAWTDAGGALATEVVERPRGTLTVNLRPKLIADEEEVRQAIDDPTIELVDALPPPIYSGEMTLYSRPGHIPGAVNVPTFSLIDEAGRFKSDVELKNLFGDNDDKRSIHYCGGGIAASTTAFALVRAGHSDVAVYTASLQEWTADPDNPMETGPAAE